MGLDLFILDDNNHVREMLTGYADQFNISVVPYSSGVEALNFLRDCEPSDFPGTYLVDMRIPGSEEELASSLEIYRFLEAQGKVDNFYFITGNISDHDRKVAADTGAEIILKNPAGLESIVRIIRNSKRD